MLLSFYHNTAIFKNSKFSWPHTAFRHHSQCASSQCIAQGKPLVVKEHIKNIWANELSGAHTYAKQVKLSTDWGYWGSHHLAVYCIDSWAASLRRAFWRTAHKAREAQSVVNMKLSITSRSHILWIRILTHSSHKCSPYSSWFYVGFSCSSFSFRAVLNTPLHPLALYLIKGAMGGRM